MYDQSDKDEIQLALCSLWQGLDHTGKALPIETQRAYVMAFEYEGLSVEQVKRSCLVGLGRFDYFPKPKGLIELAIGTGADRMTEAWRQLNKALDLYGTAHGFTFDDPKLVAAVQAMGGLATMAQMSKKEFASFGWHRFKEIYGSVGEASGRLVVFQGGKRLAIVDGQPLGLPTVKRIAADGQLAKPCIEAVKQCGQPRPRGITHVSEAMEVSSG